MANDNRNEALSTQETESTLWSLAKSRFAKSVLVVAGTGSILLVGCNSEKAMGSDAQAKAPINPDHVATAAPAAPTGSPVEGVGFAPTATTHEPTPATSSSENTPADTTETGRIQKYIITADQVNEAKTPEAIRKLFAIPVDPNLSPKEEGLVLENRIEAFLEMGHTPSAFKEVVNQNTILVEYTMAHGGNDALEGIVGPTMAANNKIPSQLEALKKYFDGRYTGAALLGNYDLKPVVKLVSSSSKKNNDSINSQDLTATYIVTDKLPAGESVAVLTPEEFKVSVDAHMGEYNDTGTYEANMTMTVAELKEK